jgi:hypothetical protein
MANQEAVKAFLIDEWSNDAVEVQSSGDTSVTLALPVCVDLTALVYDLKEGFDANCDLQVGCDGTHVVVHTTGRKSSSTEARTPQFMWYILLVAIASIFTSVSTIYVDSAMNTTIIGLEFIANKLRQTLTTV